MVITNFFGQKTVITFFLAKMDIFDQKKTLKPGFLTKNRYSQTIIIVFFFSQKSEYFLKPKNKLMSYFIIVALLNQGK